MVREETDMIRDWYSAVRVEGEGMCSLVCLKETDCYASYIRDGETTCFLSKQDSSDRLSSVSVILFRKKCKSGMYMFTSEINI